MICLSLKEYLCNLKVLSRPDHTIHQYGFGLDRLSLRVKCFWQLVFICWSWVYHQLLYDGNMMPDITDLLGCNGNFIKGVTCEAGNAHSCGPPRFTTCELPCCILYVTLLGPGLSMLPWLAPVSLCYFAWPRSLYVTLTGPGLCMLPLSAPVSLCYPDWPRSLNATLPGPGLMELA